MALISSLTLLTPAFALQSPTPVKPEIVHLWPDGAPGAVGDEERDRPSLTVYLPEASQSNGTALVVCPGGGYGALAVDHEGRQVAQWLNSLGVSAFIL
jgi:hypothetical protein